MKEKAQSGQKKVRYSGIRPQIGGGFDYGSGKVEGYSATRAGKVIIRAAVNRVDKEALRGYGDGLRFMERPFSSDGLIDGERDKVNLVIDTIDDLSDKAEGKNNKKAKGLQERIVVKRARLIDRQDQRISDRENKQ